MRLLHRQCWIVLRRIRCERKKKKNQRVPGRCSFWGFCYCLSVWLSQIHDGYTVTAIPAQSVVNPDDKRSCFITQTRCLPALPALARPKVPRPNRWFTSSIACISRTRISGMSASKSSVSWWRVAGGRLQVHQHDAGFGVLEAGAVDAFDDGVGRLRDVRAVAGG